MDRIRKRNINLEGKRLKVEKEAQRDHRYPLNSKTKDHVEQLNRISIEQIMGKTDIEDHKNHPIVGGKNAQIQISVRKLRTEINDEKQKQAHRKKIKTQNTSLNYEAERSHSAM